MRGKIKWFSHSHGYGFITGLDGKDYFFHTRDAECNEKEFVKGKEVMFSPAMLNESACAEEVRIS